MYKEFFDDQKVISFLDAELKRELDWLLFRGYELPKTAPNKSYFDTVTILPNTGWKVENFPFYLMIPFANRFKISGVFYCRMIPYYAGLIGMRYVRFAKWDFSEYNKANPPKTR